MKLCIFLKLSFQEINRIHTVMKLGHFKWRQFENREEKESEGLRAATRNNDILSAVVRAGKRRLETCQQQKPTLEEEKTGSSQEQNIWPSIHQSVSQN